MSTQNMLNLPEAFEIIDRVIDRPFLKEETVPAAQASGYILGRDLDCLLDLPPFDKSAMDGYALCDDRPQGPYVIDRTVPAGQEAPAPLAQGHCVKVMTGAPVPPGTRRVHRHEKTRREKNILHIIDPDDSVNICMKGEDVKAGDPAAQAGLRLEPRHIAHLVSCGHAILPVIEKPTVTIISTGDELTDNVSGATGAKIMDSNGPMLASLCSVFGMQVNNVIHVPDRLDMTLKALKNALDESMMVIFTGGVSQGDFDYCIEAMDKNGLKIHFTRLAVKPGRPSVFASGRGKTVFGLPGNPVSSYLMFHLLVRRAALRLAGFNMKQHILHVPMAASFSRKKTSRRQYVPAKLNDEGKAETITYHGSAHMASLFSAHGFAVMPRGVSVLEAGHKVEFLVTGRMS